MLSKDFLRLVLISTLFAFPVAWRAMHSWLSNYAYRINISAWVFVAAGVMGAADSTDDDQFSGSEGSNG